MHAMMGASLEPQMKRAFCLSVRCRQSRDLIFNLRIPNTTKSLYLGYESCAHDYYQKITANLQKYTKKEDFFQELKFFGESLQKLGMEATRLLVFREGVDDCLNVFTAVDKARRKLKRSRDHYEQSSTELSNFLDSAVQYCADGSLSSHQVIDSLRYFGMQHYMNFKLKKDKLSRKMKSPHDVMTITENSIVERMAEKSSIAEDKGNIPIQVVEEKSSAPKRLTAVVKYEEHHETAEVNHRRLRSADN